MNKRKQCSNTIRRMALGVCAVLLACLWLAGHAVAEGKQYGWVNQNQVRFRRQADSTDVWAMLDKGWRVEIMGTKKADGVAYYFVVSGTPKNPTREYWGYIAQSCVNLEASSAAAAPTAAPAAAQPAPAASAGNGVLGYIQFVERNVNLRKGPSTGSEALGRFDKDEVIAYYGTAESHGRTWYLVQKNGQQGYVLGTCVQLAGSGTAAPGATPAPDAAATPSGNADYIQTTKDKVWIRKAPSTEAHTKGQAALGTVLHTTGTVAENGARWYLVEVEGTVCYIMAKYCQPVTEAEYKAYQAAHTPAPVTAAPAKADQSNLAATTKERVILRAAGEADGTELTVLNSAGKVCTLLGGTNVSDGYTWYQVQVKGMTGWIRGDLLRVLSKAEAAAYEKSAAAGVALNKPELADWNTSDIQRVFYKGCVATLTDVKTGISFKIKRWSGGQHADVEPLTAADTAAMCKVYGVSKSQEIEEKNLYQRRAVLITVGGRTFAASMFGFAHNYPEGDTIANNEFKGQFCIHFVNSKIHKSQKVDQDHQNAIQYAYKNAETMLGKYGYTFQ